MVVASRDAALGCRVVDATPLTFENTATLASETADDVRDTSRIVHLVNREALVSDEGNSLILIDLESHRVRSQGLSPAEEGERANTILDLETCTPVPGSDGQQLLAFGSGSSESREWIVVVDWRTPSDPPRTLLHEAPEFFRTLRGPDGFDREALNIEGAIFVGEDTLRFFHRPRANGAGGDYDATVDVRWRELEMYLKDPTRAPAPAPAPHRRYDFGTHDGCQLTFSDATVVRDGNALLYTAAAEDDGGIAGSVLGLLDDDGARYAPIEAEDGAVFNDKIEGLRLHPSKPGRLQFVIDTEDINASHIFEATLTGPWNL
jgi:hypothetical protein